MRINVVAVLVFSSIFFGSSASADSIQWGRYQPSGFVAGSIFWPSNYGYETYEEYFGTNTSLSHDISLSTARASSSARVTFETFREGKSAKYTFSGGTKVFIPEGFGASASFATNDSLYFTPGKSGRLVVNYNYIADNSFDTADDGTSNHQFYSSGSVVGNGIGNGFQIISDRLSSVNASSGWFEVGTEEFGSLAIYLSTSGESRFNSGSQANSLSISFDFVGDDEESSMETPVMPTVYDATQFVFVATPGRPVYIDPFYATGYDYVVMDGPNITSAIFPLVPGDSDGYDVFGWDGTGYSIALGRAAAGSLFEFGGLGVGRFAIRGIDLTAAIDPANPQGFVTGLNFVGAGLVTMTQSPVSTFVSGNAVPEPAAWGLMIASFGVIGGVTRRRRHLSFA